MNALVFLNAAAVFAASAGDDEGWGGIGIIFLFSGIVFYTIMYLRYRNTDKRHHHEKETEAERVNEVANDQFIEKRKGLSNSRMRNANETSVRGKLDASGIANTILKNFNPKDF